MTKKKGTAVSLKFKFLDQVFAAFNTYLLLIPSLFQKDFDSIAKMSLIVSLFAFWQSLIRISVINEVLDFRNESTRFLNHVTRVIKISISSFVLIFLAEWLKIALSQVLILIGVILTGVQVELVRQYWLGKEKFLIALFVDLSWFCPSVLIISLQVFNFDSLLPWLIGALISLGIGLTTLKRETHSVVQQTNIVKVSSLMLTIPILLALYTVLQNAIYSGSVGSIQLGQLRTIQLFFLPAIFLIGVQQSVFVPPMTQGKIYEVNRIWHSLKWLSLTISMVGAFFAELYFHAEYRNLTVLSLILLVILSVQVNLRVGYLSLWLLTSGFGLKLIIARVIWFVTSISVMFSQRNELKIGLVGLLLVDLGFMFYLNFRVGEKLRVKKNVKCL